MHATTIQQAIQQLKESIFVRVRHRALLQYIEAPSIDENQLFFLLLPFLNGESWNEGIQEGATTVGIIQASLFEHDKIKEKEATSKEQQLTVLSGDYYSGRYYEILARTGNIVLIQKLAQGIVERCEQEIAAYEHTYRTMEQWVENLCVIETAIIRKFYEAHCFDKYSATMMHILTIQRLQNELDGCSQHVSTVVGRAMEKCFGADELKHLLAEAIEAQRKTLIAELATLQLSDELQQFIWRIVKVETR
ncbi:heptaprenyl diphosphate synthase component 1 [Metasolibacillus sp.]|uniref:heptaprenyl diphosphate synthase component 1 n=1 Tax=Metasolibacillus sp. TaxID=2703680 RepID=UPI0025F44599|nr:heptaprenyl diphosphate synthase component 1 [Metasolibacillus sp.]MCT6923152.1 heptaprenyl diphosphate synthase component 1 [Metasolibacillus sp.]MCT6939543.1 heptaprenyl diphosphate synthase component 1 [Metasolibacillus sp.]